MTKELWIVVWQSLCMGFAFLIPLALCRLADIAFGVVSSFKFEGIKFNWKKLLSGVFSTAILLAGLACLISGVTMIPELIKNYSIQIVDAEILGEIVDGVMIASTIIISALTYGKDAFAKFKSLIIK